MIIDNLLVLGDAQVVTASAATTNVVDQLAAGDAISRGAVVQFLIDTTCAATGGASNVTFALQTATDEAFTTPVTLASSAAIAKASLTAGAVPFQAVIPPGALRYLRGYYTVDTNNLTSGKIDCRIVLDQDKTIDKVL